MQTEKYFGVLVWINVGWGVVECGGWFCGDGGMERGLRGEICHTYNQVWKNIRLDNHKIYLFLPLSLSVQSIYLTNITIVCIDQDNIIYTHNI